MPTPRFFIPAPLQSGITLDLPDAAAHHAKRVLRLRDGDAVILFDGQGGQYPATLHMATSQVQATLGTHEPHEAELTGRIRLVQALATGNKMDWIVEKAVELGAHAVRPIAGDRSVLQLRGERRDKRMQHWRNIAQAASEQCGRNRLMAIEPLSSLRDTLPDIATGPHGVSFLCHPDFGVPLGDAIAEFKRHLATHTPSGPPCLDLLVGPEGGWSDQELEQAQRYGVAPVQFGPRILRTETAGLALISACTALLGWNTPDDTQSHSTQGSGIVAS